MRLIVIALLLAAPLGAGCKKKTAASASAAPAAPSGAGGSTEMSGGGGGGVMAGRRAVGRAIDANELSQFATSLEAAMKEDAVNIPPQSFVIQQFKGKPGYEVIIEAIEKGDFIYRSGASRGGLWGYGKHQDNGRKHPAIVGGRATRLDADELRQHLGS